MMIVPFRSMYTVRLWMKIPFPWLHPVQLCFRVIVMMGLCLHFLDVLPTRPLPSPCLEGRLLAIGDACSVMVDIHLLLLLILSCSYGTNDNVHVQRCVCSCTPPYSPPQSPPSIDAQAADHGHAIWYW
jgi:hypothetical protein